MTAGDKRDIEEGYAERLHNRYTWRLITASQGLNECISCFSPVCLCLHICVVGGQFHYFT
jgi:hypothetical protein